MGQTELRISKESREYYGISETLFSSEETIQALYQQAQRVAMQINSRKTDSDTYVKASELYAIGIIRLIQREVIKAFCSQQGIDLKDTVLKAYQLKDLEITTVDELLSQFFPATITRNLPESSRIAVEEILLLEVSQQNPAVMSKMPDILKNDRLKAAELYRQAVDILLETIESIPGIGEESHDLFTFLCTPARVSPENLSGQLDYILNNWRKYIEKYDKALLRALDFIQEEDRPVFPPGPGPSETPDYSSMDKEFEAFSSDSDWMPNVIMLAKSTLVWLDQLTKEYGYPIQRLDQIPDRELDLIAERGFTALWLIGLWERSRASKRIKNKCGNPEAEASAYSLYGYDISQELGGWEALQNLRERCRERGIRLASDMVPNHTGLDSEWMINRPELFMQTDSSPFPAYTYNGENLSGSPDIGIYIDDHYYDQTDAAVTFKRVDHRTGEVSYIYHGNDGTGMPWNDTAQLDYLNPQTREAVIQTIIHVAKNFPIIRFDAAMTLAKKHIQRLWYPIPGSGGDIPSRSVYGMGQKEFDRAMPVEFWREVVDRVGEEAPDTLLLAEAFWMMEGYFVRTLGMHRVYNSAFMNMLKNEENRKYRDTIKNTISFDPEILKRYVNFMNNPDEDTAIAQFGDGDKYFGVCTLLITMPGLPMFGHGQIEGYREKYGMEFRRAYWNERPDQYLVGKHYERIFPLMRKRYLFSNAEHFALYDVHNHGTVLENVFAFTNRAGEERALVLYNNAYEYAAGRIKSSAPMLRRFADDDRQLVTIEIDEALGLTAGQHNFFTCRGYHDGLTYVRSSQEVCERGMFIALKGYETQIYLDFSEIEDTDGLYARLCEELNGTGTRDLERDIRRLRYSEIIHAAKPFYQDPTIDLMRDLCTRGGTEQAAELYSILSSAYSDIKSAWLTTPFGRDSALPTVLDGSAVHILQESIKMIQRMAQAAPDNSYLSNSMFIMPEVPTILLVWILLQPIASAYTDRSEIPDIGKELLIEEHIREPLRERSVPSEEAERLVGAASILIKHAGWYTERAGEEASETMLLATLLEDPLVRTFIRLNWYDGKEWYHKESLQECFFWLYLAEILKHPESAEDRGFRRVVETWLRKELFAGYQVRRLLE